MKYLTVRAINLYQKTLSPDHGWLKIRHPYGFCRYYPSCSEYTKRMVLKHGLLFGLLAGLKRVVTCNPWTKPTANIINS